jgi:pyridoxamine 5'-phosphate oxidase
MVLAKGFCERTGHVVFYTHFGSRKGRELDAGRRAAAVWYWEEFGGRQLRIEGGVTRSPASESDAYFSTRPAGSQINAWVSRQSEPLQDSESLERAALAKAEAFGLPAAALEQLQPAPVARPPHWGGYRLWAEKIEFWREGAGRFHERLVYERLDPPGGDGSAESPHWRMTRLQP